MVVKQGTRWRKGIGANIRLFGEPWLKEGLFLKTDSPIYASLAHVKVKDILKKSSKVWNVHLIYNFLLSKYGPTDVEFTSTTSG